MIEPTLTAEAVLFEVFWANLGMRVPPALTVMVPVMWHVAPSAQQALQS
jgi:hypothetical protein